MPAEFHEAHCGGFQRYLDTREPRIIGRTVELRGRRKSGEIFPLEMSLSAIDLPDGVGFLGAIRDLTERVRLQGRIVQAEKLASLGLLSAGVAHEINNPLAYVINNLAVLDRDFHGLARVLAEYEEARPILDDDRSRDGGTDRRAHAGARPALHPGEPRPDSEEHAARGQASVRASWRTCASLPGSTRPPSTGWT